MPDMEVTIFDLEHPYATDHDKDEKAAAEVHGLTNLARANRVLVVLKAYGAHMGARNDDAKSTLSDFLSDLMHLARMNGIEMDAVTFTAENNHSSEKDSYFP